LKIWWYLLLIVCAIAVLPRVAACAEVIDWMSDYATGLERARIERKPVMIDFYTLWCYYCKVLDAKTYTDPGVVAVCKDLVCLKINAERERALAREFRISAYPIIVFLSRDGMEIKRVYGYQPAAVLKRELEKILADTGRLDMLAERYRKNPGDEETGYLYADELMAKDRFPEAEKVLAKLLRNASKKRSADVVLDVAICRLKEGKYKAAASELAKFLSRFKTRERIDEAELFYGISLIASGQKVKGIQALEKLQERASGKWVGREALRQTTAARRGAD